MLLTSAVLAAAFAVRAVVGVAVWGQCGGSGYGGSTTCDNGSTCVKMNDYYSQCQPGTAAPTTTPAPGSTTTPAPGTTLPGTSSTTSASTPGNTGTTGTPPAAGYKQMSNFGSNPNNVGMYSYVPAGLTANPGLVVAIHYCTGSAQGYYTGTQWKSLADSKKNFIVIYPDSPRSGKCFDVSTAPTLKHDGGSDSLGIANAVRYAISTWGVDKTKVFVSGSSSGAMMANVMAGAYPDLFVAAGAVAGVPYACFATTDGSMWNNACAGGQTTKTGAQWGDLVRAAYSGYTGSYPRIILLHGTSDTTLNYHNFGEEIKEWTNVWKISESAASTAQNDPSSGWTHTTYGTGQVQAYSLSGGTHDIAYNNVHEDKQIAFFGL